MAAKAKATSKNNSGAKGLQLTTAQRAAYNKAYSAAATAKRTQLSIARSAQGLRKYRLQAAHAIVAKAKVARASAQTAAIAAYATRRTYVQSRLAHQNAALQARIEANMLRHATLYGRAQYVAAGEKAYAHSAILATLTTAKATTIEAKAYKTAVKASKSTTPPTNTKPGPNSAAIAAAGKAAGLKAAKATAPGTPAKARTAPNYGNMYAAMYAAHTRSAEKPDVSQVQWHGDEVTPNCVITAIANHLLHIKNVKVADSFLTELFESCKPEPAIEEVLWQAWLTGWPGNGVHLKNYRPATTNTGSSMCLVIGFEVACDDGVTRDHAALSLGGHKVVSWGKVSEYDAAIEEAWDLEWES
jgi:hypothetical protein